MDEIIRNSVVVYEGQIYMYSGSHREEFRFNSSDRDLMFWCTIHVYNCICDMSNFADSYPYTILMEHFFAPPGFVRLKLLTPVRYLRLQCFVVIHMNNCYISSTNFSSTMHYSLTNSRIFTENLRLHGPCSSFYSGGIEMYGLSILASNSTTLDR